MPVERNTPTTSGTLDIKAEPGVLLYPEGGRDATNSGARLIVTGSQGVRFLSKLIEEATALRDELGAVVG